MVGLGLGRRLVINEVAYVGVWSGIEGLLGRFLHLRGVDGQRVLMP